MTAPSSGDPASTVQGTHEYIAIPISSLRLDTVTNFDIYLQPEPGQPYVLYAQRNIPFTQASRKRLLANNVDCVYISTEQQYDYGRYLETNLPYLLKDSKLTSVAKSEILHSCAHGLMQEVFENPRLEGGARRCRDVVRNTIDFVFAERSALRDLIETASTDYKMYTHSVNGCVLGIALALRVGFRIPRLLNELGRGALFRDIGMTQMDAELLRSPAELTEQQFEDFRRHTIIGEQIVRDHGETSTIVLGIVRGHHERMDGSGYPDKLYEEHIPPMVRVMAITDVFDALTTSRPYRDALTTFEALNLMKKEMRSELDQEYLHEFIELMGNPDI